MTPAHHRDLNQAAIRKILREFSPNLVWLDEYRQRTVFGDEVDDSASEFVSLWTRYQPEVRRYVGMLVPKAADADDVMQQTASRLWEKFEEYDPDRPFVAWAIGFAYHEVLSWRQKQSRDRLVFSAEILAQLHATIGQESSLLELRRRTLDGCLQKLSDKERRLILQRTRNTAPFSGKRSSRESVRTSCTTPSKNSDCGCSRASTTRCGRRAGSMDNPSDQSNLNRLLARLVDGEATGDDIAALEKLLDGNADAQRRYVHYVDLHAELLSRSDVARTIPSSVGTDDSGRAAIPEPPTTRPVWSPRLRPSS